jgi:type I restriction enzyme S subunit
MIVPFSEIVYTLKGKNPPIKSKEKQKDYIPYIDIKAFEQGIFETYTNGDKCIFCDDGDILLVWDGARAGLVGTAYKGAVGSTLVKISVPYIERKYVLYFLQYYSRELNAKPKGTGIPHINPNVFNSLPFPLPPLTEQHHIVAKIDAIFSELVNGVALLKTIKTQLAIYRQAVLKWAFEGKLKECHVDNWMETTLGKVCKISSGGTPSRRNSQYYKGDIPWIKTGEINWNTITDSEEHITKEAIENSSAKFFPAGTVLVAMYGQGLTRGRAAILGTKATTNQAVCALIPSDSVNNIFLYYFFRNNYWNLRERAVGGNQLNLSANLIFDIKIKLPSKPEQLAIVSAIESRLSVCDKLEQTIDQTLALSVSLRQSILKKAFEGRLVPQDPNDEPAEKLLERIKAEKAAALAKQKQTRKLGKR